MPFAKSIKLTLIALAGFVAVAALTLVVRQRRSDPGGISSATAYDFGDVVQGQPVEHEFAWRNNAATPLAVDTVITAYAPTPSRRAVATGSPCRSIQRRRWGVTRRASSFVPTARNIRRSRSRPGRSWTTW